MYSSAEAIDWCTEFWVHTSDCTRVLPPCAGDAPAGSAQPATDFEREPTVDSESDLHIRLADADDDAFILALADRFVDGFELPAWRRRRDCAEAIRADLARHLTEQPPGSHVFVAENDDGERVGFIHLQLVLDFFSRAQNCHVSDLAVAAAHDGKGVGRALLAYAERFAREHRCRHVQLAVFPGNARARALYERSGFGVETLRMMKPLR